MLATDQLETVLISTEPSPTGHERIVVAFRDGDDLYIPLDSERPANDDVLRCEYLYVRQAGADEEYTIFAVEDHHALGLEDRKRLEQFAHKPISVTTEVLHLSGTQTTVERLQPEPAGFVVVIDGSERAGRALRPAQAIAEWYGRPLVVCAVTGGADASDSRAGIRLQIEGTGLEEQDLTFVKRADLDRHLFDWMHQDQIVVASAFGVWAADGRIHGMVNRLVRDNAPAIIGIGPNVPSDWAPRSDQPLVLFVDASEHAHDIVEGIDKLLDPPRAPLMVAHVTTEDPPNRTVAKKVATEIHRRFGMPVQAKTVQGCTASEAIATVASTVDAQMVVLTSWHRPSAGTPTVASTSVSAVAHAECPVVILTAPSRQS